MDTCELNAIRRIGEEVAQLRDEVFIPLSEIAKQLAALNDAARSIIRMVEERRQNGRE